MIQVFIAGVVCPTVEEDRILLNRLLRDIENPEEKQADYSKAFLIQNTPEIARLFSMIFEVNGDISNTTATNFNPDFNPNLKADIVLTNDNMPLFSGYCQMQNIIIKEQRIQYEIAGFAQTGNFYNDIRNLTLNDIDFSDLNHAWTRANVVASWSPTLGQGYVYPMIDYGVTTNYEQWTVTAFRPAVFVKDIIDRIFRAVGWSYSSAFFTTDRFKRLVIPFNLEKLILDNQEIEDRSFLVGNNADQTIDCGDFYNPNSQPVMQFNTDSGLLGSYSLYNTSTNAYATGSGAVTIDKAGFYCIGMQGTVTINTTGITTLRNQFRMSVYLVRAGVTTILDSVSIYDDVPYGAVPYSFTTIPVSLLVGDAVYMSASHFGYTKFVNVAIPGGKGTVKQVGGFIPTTGQMEAEFTQPSYFSLIAQPDLFYGADIDMNAILPNDIKQTDFLNGIAKMFNLYFDQTDDRTILIEPREDYFLSTTTDWTTKIHTGDDEKPVTFTPMGMNQQKRYRFTYEEDSDYLNARYKNGYQQVYGTHLHDVNNDFLTEEKVIKPIFAATPLSNVRFGTNNRIIPEITFGTREQGKEPPKAGQSKIRILYWGGLTNCNTWNLRTQPETAIDTANDLTQYPYAGHLDNPYTPSFDLSFGTPKAVYYDNNIGAEGTVTYTDINLFTQYWHQTIEEFTNKNSKVLEAWFDLTIYDYLTISFRNQFFIKEAYYRLLEVTDFDIKGNQLTKCKLLKIDREQAYVTSSKGLRGGAGTFDSAKDLPERKGSDIASNGNVTRNIKSFKGYGNFNASDTGTVTGSGNNIPFASDQVHIIGSDGVNVSAERVFVHNSSGLNVVRPGAYINGVPLEHKYSQTVDSTYVESIDNSTADQFLPITASNEYYQLNKVFVTIGSGTTNYTNPGAGDIEFLINGVVILTIAKANWIGLGEGVIAYDVTPVSSIAFGYGVDIRITGDITAGDRDIDIAMYYNIITA